MKKILGGSTLKGKNALVTGTNRGIGRVIIEKFASQGVNIWAHARKKDEEFERRLGQLRDSYGVWIRPVYFDVTETELMKKEIMPIIKGGEKIDILVNNAGIAHGGFFSMTKIEKIKEVFDVNFFSVMELTQLILRKMMRQKSGAIINMSSIAAIHVRPGNSAYGVSKAAVKMWGETLAAEMATYGIRVNNIAPSLTDTDMACQMEAKAEERMIQNSAMKRLASPEEIANVVAFLASDEASFINGHTLIVDGGATVLYG